MDAKEFELGKYYKHNSGKKLYICGVCATKTYGICLMGEDNCGNFIPTGRHEGATLNFHEISEDEFFQRERK